MNNEFIFGVKFMMNGQEKFTQMKANSKELGNAIDQTPNNNRKTERRVDGLFEKVLRFFIA
jgi:hypothetical protein